SDGTPDQMYLAMYDNPNAGYLQLNTNQVSANTMNMLAVTYTSVTGSTVLYVDGSAVATGTDTGFDLASVAGNYSGGTSAEDGIGYFGAYMASPSAGGTTADFLIYNDAQTAASVLADYQSGFPVPEPATLGLFAIGGLGMLLIGRKRAAHRSA
ncbi:MAG: PEP-CTERM sorting domain-containing protein, partial [Phycisphaerae bacterium]